MQAEIMDVEAVPVLEFTLSHPTTFSSPNQLTMCRLQPGALWPFTLFVLALIALSEPCVIKYRMCRGNVNGYSEFLERFYNVTSADECHVNCQTVFPQTAAYYQFFEGPKRQICACLKSCIVANYKIMGLEIGSINGRDPNNICP